MNRQIGAINGLAIVLVVLNHSIHMSTTMPQALGYPAVTGAWNILLILLQILGTYAVPTFLFGSGSFVVYVAQSGTLSQSYRALLVRLRHIFWPYLFWSSVFYLVVFVQWGEYYSILGYIKNLLVGYPFNYVPLLVLYYMLAPLLVRLGKRHSMAMVVAIGVYQLILINLLNSNALGFKFPDWMQILVPRVVSTTLAKWAIYFPLGIAYSLNSKKLMPILRKVRWELVALAVILLVLYILNEANILRVPLAGEIAALPIICLLPLIKRDSIPLLKPLEWIGRMSFGLYLSNLIVADVFIWLMEGLMPGLLAYQILLEPLVFIATLSIPLIIMWGMSQLPPIRGAYHYVFG
jgi:peptidoglycan/LPS O-acetylase OafA/YrhL